MLELLGDEFVGDENGHIVVAAIFLGSVGSQFLFSRNGVSEFLAFDVPSLPPH